MIALQPPLQLMLWLALQDEILRRAVAFHGGRNWKQIGRPQVTLMPIPDIFLTCKLTDTGDAAEYFEGRTDVQCLHRWQKVLNPELVKGPWTPEVSILGLAVVGLPKR